MKVLVIGAAGKTGRAVVDRAIEAGHEVTALVHDRTGYDVHGVKVRAGDATDPAVVSDAVQGQDAVIDTVGGKTPYKRTTLETAIATGVVKAMQQHGVRRLLVTSSVGVNDSSANTPGMVKVVVATFLRGSTRDKAGMEAVVSGSGLDWTILRPAVLSDDAATGEVRVFTGQEKAHSMTRADLAVFLVQQLLSEEHVRKAVVIGNK